MILDLRILYGLEYRSVNFLDFLSAITTISLEGSFVHKALPSPIDEDQLVPSTEYQESQHAHATGPS